MRVFNLILFVLLTTFGNSQTVDYIPVDEFPHILSLGDTSFKKLYPDGDTVFYKVDSAYESAWSHFDSKEGFINKRGKLQMVQTDSWANVYLSGSYWEKWVYRGFPPHTKEQHYRFVYNRLDGIQSISKSELSEPVKSYSENNAVIIAGHLVDAFNDHPQFVSGFAVDFSDWQWYSFNEGIHGWSYLPRLNTYKEEELYYDLEKMVNIFLDDYKNHLRLFTLREEIFGNSFSDFLDYYYDVYEPLEEKLNNIKIIAHFEDLEDGVLAKSYGIDNEEYIIIKVDPDEWMNTNLCNRWYTLYHELGHDVLNFRHGQGGRMMFNYPTKIYSWEDFFKDRNQMFLNALLREHPDADFMTKSAFELR